MADKKISALTASTVPLAGSEVLPIVQGGTTVKVSVANLTAGRSSEGLTFGANSGSLGGAFLNLANPSFAGSRFWKFQNDVSAFGDWVLAQSTDNTGASYTTRFYFDASGNAEVSTGNLKLATAGKGIDFSANANAPGMTSELLNWYEEGTFTPVWNGGTVTVGLSKYTRIGRVVVWHFDLTFGASAVVAASTLTLPFPCADSWGAGSINFTDVGAALFVNLEGVTDTLQFRSAADAASAAVSTMATKRVVGMAIYNA